MLTFLRNSTLWLLLFILLLISSLLLFRSPPLQAQQQQDELVFASGFDDVKNDSPVWLQTDVLQISFGNPQPRDFGNAVAIDGDTVVVGAENTVVSGFGSLGTAYVFIKTNSGWEMQQMLVAEDGDAGDRFGVSVAISGETIIVGAERATVNDSDYHGAAYVFVRSGSEWSQQQKLVADDGAGSDYFGASVGLDGDTALVGVPGSDIEPQDNRGAAYVFVRSGSDWMQEQRLYAEDGSANDGFGTSVALDTDRALIGSSFSEIDGNEDQGSAYVFERIGSTWSLRQKLVAEDGSPSIRFGRTVAMDNNTILVANRGFPASTYVFVNTAGVWTQQQKLDVNDSDVGPDIGESLALDGDTALIGARYAEIDSYYNQGVAYVFVRTGTSNWVEQQRLISDAVGNDYQFGSAVAIEADTVVVGAIRADDSNGGTGKAYVFERDRLEQQIEFPTPSTGHVGEEIVLSATATSNLPVSYQSDTASICTVSGDVASLVADGECRITASQPGDGIYAPASDVTVTFLVEAVVIDANLYLPVIVK